MRNIYLIISFILVSVFAFGQSANFSTDLTNNDNCGGTIVTFTIDDTTGINTYNWSFGNGEVDAGGTISPTDSGSASSSYMVFGAFTVELTVNGNISTTQIISIFNSPDPSFVINNGDACLNGVHTVSFDYTGTGTSYGGTVNRWKWNFGDGTGDHLYTTTGDVDYDYTASGNYNIVLEVTDDNNCKADSFIVAGVKLPSTPVAKFSSSYPSNCAMPIDVVFTDLSTDDDLSIISWDWIITDKATGAVAFTDTLQNPTITFTNAGEYDVKLKVTTSGGCSDETIKTISFNANTVGFTPTSVQSICPGHSISFTNTSIDGFTGTPNSFLWDFGDGITSTDENPSHQYTTNTGTPFTVSLTVEFSNNCVDVHTISDLVEVSNVDNLDFVTANNESCKNYTVALNADTGFVNYEWDFNYDGVTPNITASSTSKVMSHYYTAEGDYRIYLRATNSIGCLAEHVDSTIKIKYPVAEFTTVSGKLACGGETANFDASASINTLPSSHNSIIKYHWDFNGDSVKDITTTTPIASYKYSVEGKFNVGLVIETEAGCLDTINKIEEVQRGYPPNASFVYTQANRCINTPIDFVSTSTPYYLSQDPIDSVYWSFGEGTIIRSDTSENAVSQVYKDDTEDDGVPYIVELTVYENGCASTTSDTAIIRINQPVARFEAISDVDCQGGAGTFTFNAFDGNRLSEGVDQYRWDFGDGNYYPGPTASDWATGNDPTTTHSFSSIGNYDVHLFVTKNGTICEDSYVKTFHVNYNVIAFNASDTIVCKNNDNVIFNNQSSSSAGSVSYLWSFGANARPSTSTKEIPDPVKYKVSGLKDVKLVMTDVHGCVKTLIKQQYIDARGPVADYDWITTNADSVAQCLNNGDNVTFTSTSDTYPNLNTNVSYKWNFGVGGNPPTASRNNEDPIVVAYQSVGKKTVSLLVTDDDGCYDKKIIKRLIIVPKPIAAFDITAPQNCITDDITFADNSSDESFANIHTWQWDFGSDASPATFSGENPPAIQYSAGGIKNIDLIVTDNYNCVDTVDHDYNIYVANASYTNDPNPGCSPAAVTFTNTSTNTKAWKWEFGDALASTSTKENPTNIFFYPGEFDVQLITTSLGGCIDTSNIITAVKVDGPYYDSISMTLDQPCLQSPSDPVAVFTVYGLHDVKKVRFDFGDATVAFDTTLADASNPPASFDITHTYSTQGTFTVKMTLEDDPALVGACGEVAYFPNLSAIVIGSRPTANYTTDAIAGQSCVNMRVKFYDSSVDNDPDHSVNSWHYEFGDVGGSTSTSKNPTHKYLHQGDVYITHKVTTSLGCFDTITKMLTILPGIHDSSVATDDTLCQGEISILDAATPTGGDGTYNYSWRKSYNNHNWHTAPSPHSSEDYITHSTIPTGVETIFYKRKVTSNNCRIYGPSFSVTTYPTSDGGVLNPVDQTLCYDGNSGSVNLHNRVGTVLKWQSDTISDFSTLSDIANTSDALSFANLTDSTFYRVIVKSGVCPRDTSDIAAVNIIPEIKGNVIYPIDTLLCVQQSAGTILPTPPTGGAGGFTYQWQKSIDNISFSDIAGATAESYSPGGLNITTYFRRNVITAVSCNEYSNSFEIEIILAPIDDKILSDPFVCAEAPTATTLIVLSNSQPGIKYQLRRDIDDTPIGVPIIGDGNDINLTVITPIQTTLYNVWAEDTLPNGAGFICAGVELSHKAKITIIPIPADNLVVSDPTVCPGSYFNITVFNSELKVKYYLEDAAGSTLFYQIGDGSNLNFSLLNTVSNSTFATVEAVSTMQNEMCARVQLFDSSIITVIQPPDTTGNVSDAEICAGTGGINITVGNTSIDYKYSLYDVNGIFIETKQGNNGILTYVLPEPTTSTSYQVWASTTLTNYYGVCDSIMFPDLAIVDYAEYPDTNLVVNGDKVCTGSSAIVEVENSEIGVNYSLFLGIQVVGSSIDGTGGNIHFPISSVTTTQSYSIKAKSTMFSTPCGLVDLVDTALVIVEQPPLDVPIEANPDPTNICSGAPLDIIVKGSQIGMEYQLRINGNTTAIDSKIGTGNDLPFTVFPTAADVYSVFVEPVSSASIPCSGVLLSSTVTVNFDGPLSISQQPANANVCSGTQANFNAIAQNDAGNGLTYQWQVRDLGAAVYNSVPSAPPYSGALTNHLVISDVTGLGGNNYRLIIRSSVSICDSIISDSARLNVAATPIVDSLTISIDDVCQGTDIIVGYHTKLKINEQYNIIFNYTGANVKSLDTMLVNVTAADGFITLKSDSFPNSGVTTLNVVKVDYLFSHGCQSPPFLSSDDFEINAKADTTGDVSDIELCAGSGSFNINVSNTSTDFIYSLIEVGGSFITSQQGNNGVITYTLPEPTISTSYKVWAKLAPPHAQGVCDSLMFPDLAIVDYANAPDITLSVNGDKVCQGSDANVEVVNTEAGLTYKLFYGLSQIGDSIIGTGGTIVFVVPNVTNTESYSVRVNSNVFATACNYFTLVDTAFVQMAPIPADLPIQTNPNPANICAGAPVDIIVVGSEVGMQYQLRRNGIDMPGELKAGVGGDLTFTVFPIATETYTIYVEPTTWARIPCSGIVLSADIIITFDGPLAISQQPTDANICSGTAAVFELFANNAGSTTNVIYKWQVSTNNINYTNISDGSIYYGTQNNTLAILNTAGLDGNYYRAIVKSSSFCDSLISDAGELNIASSPITSGMSITVDDVCQGDDVVIDYITNLQLNESYRIYYHSGGANSLIGPSQIVNITNATGQITFDADSFPNAGLDTIYITKIDYAYGQGCASQTLNIYDNFEINATPDITGSVSDAQICAGTGDYNITVSNTTTDVDYTLKEVGGTYSSTQTGNNATITFTLPEPTQSTSFEVWAKLSAPHSVGVCDSLMLTDMAIIDYSAYPDTTMAVNGDKVCSGNDAIIEVENTEVGVSYSLFDGLTQIGASQSGTGGNITFDIFSVTNTKSYYVKARSNAFASVCSDFIITDTALIQIAPIPSDVPLITNPDPAYICSGDSLDIIVVGSELNMKYQLLLNGVDVAGEVKNGTGNNLIFSVLPSNSDIYTIFVKPMEFVRIPCSGFELSSDIIVNFDGPLTITQQPIDAYVCAPAGNAVFEVLALNGAASPINYQWQVSTDNINYTNIVNGATYVGTTNNSLGITDVIGLDSNYYRAIVQLSSYCSADTSDAAQLILGATPIVNNITISIDNICQGEDVVLDYNTGLLANQDYRVFYNVIGANAYSYDSVIVHIAASNGQISFPAANFNNVGSNVINITEIDYAYGQGCKSSSFLASDLFDVEQVPNISNLALTSLDICIENDEAITVNGQLSNDVYNVTYNLSGANDATALSASLSFVSGSGIITIPSTELTDSGMTMFTLTEILYPYGNNCATNNFSDSVNFRVEPLPDTNSLHIDVNNICSGNDATVNISGDLVDGEYSITYDLSGANVSNSNIVVVDITSANGSGAYNILANILIDTGLTNVVIKDVAFTNGNSCDIDISNVSSSFVIEQTPDLSGLAIFAPDICEGDSAIVFFTSNLPDGNYLAYMQLTGSNPLFVDTIALELVLHNGNTLFSIDSINVSVPGLNTVAITKVVCATGLNCESLVTIQCQLNVLPLPDTNNLNFTVDSTCVNSPTTVSITGNLVDGIYIIVYDLGGANIINDKAVVVDFVNGDGTSSFEIDGTDLISVGTTSLTLKHIADQTPNACDLAINNGFVEFEVEELPIVNNVDINIDDICIGNPAIIDLTSTLNDGAYYIIYDLVNSNLNHVVYDSMIVVSGNSQLIIDTTFTNIAELTYVSVLSIISVQGEQCSSAITIIAKDSFMVEPLPDFGSAAIFAFDACQGSDVTIFGTSNLPDDSYTIYYEVSGANPLPASSVIINLTQGNGNFIFDINSSFIPNPGTNTIKISGARSNSGQQCIVDITKTSNFEVIPTPIVTNLAISPVDICLGMDEVLAVSSNLVDDRYKFIIKINGSNGSNTYVLESNFTNGDGTGTLIIPYNYLLNPGVDTVSIIEVIVDNATSCSSLVSNADTVYNIEDTPHSDTMDMVVPNICLTYPAPVDITGSLQDGVYDVVYELTGVNAIVNLNAALTVVAGNGTMEVPATLLTNVGSNNLILNSISNITPMACDIALYKSTSFIVVPDPGSLTVAISADGICLGSDAAINIASALVDGNYQFVYNLEGINIVNDIVVDITLSNGDGSGLFIIPDTLIITGGIQKIKVTEIIVSSSSACTSTGLDIPTSFNVEGNMDITNESFSGNLCPGNGIDMSVTAINNGGGNIYYQWMKSIDGLVFDTLYNQDVFSGTKTPNLKISDNSSINGLWIQCYVYSDHCANISSDSVKIVNFSGSLCGSGLENIPNAVSPNGDGINDTWVIEGIQNYSSNNVKLYNRWGNLVFEMDGYDNTNYFFDGRGNRGMGNDKDLSDGTYYYIIDMGNGQDLLKGYFVIHR